MKLAMADRGPHGMEYRCKGHIRSWNPGDRGVVRLDVESEAANQNGVEGEDPGETWFCLENSTDEAHALTHLEGELSSTVLFEHGGRKTASPLWVVHILLSHLFWERLALGQTVEAFVKHYWREAMHSLVKLQDLVDLVEPPLGGTHPTTASGQTKDEAMELDAEEE